MLGFMMILLTKIVAKTVEKAENFKFTISKKYFIKCFIFKNGVKPENSKFKPNFSNSNCLQRVSRHMG